MLLACLHDIVACGLQLQIQMRPTAFIPSSYLGLLGIIMKALLRKCGAPAASERGLYWVVVALVGRLGPWPWGVQGKLLTLSCDFWEQNLGMPKVGLEFEQGETMRRELGALYI